MLAPRRKSRYRRPGGNHDIGFRLQSTAKCLAAHLADKMIGRINVGFVQRRHPVDRRDAARTHRLLDDLAGHIGAYGGKPKVKPLLTRDVADRG